LRAKRRDELERRDDLVILQRKLAKTLGKVLKRGGKASLKNRTTSCKGFSSWFPLWRNDSYKIRIKNKSLNKGKSKEEGIYGLLWSAYEEEKRLCKA
jgi:hypothetical protein